MNIEVRNLQNQLEVEAELLGDAATFVLHNEQCSDEISIAVVDDARIAELNEQFLQHSGPTDVIAFNLNDEDDPDGLLGEVVVSAQTAKAVAERRGAPPAAELLLYVIHGVLHLLGYDDQTPADAAAMQQRQQELLDTFTEKL